eukprot:PhM_4_TR18724/c1_g1_i1/m.73273
MVHAGKTIRVGHAHGGAQMVQVRGRHRRHRRRDTLLALNHCHRGRERQLTMFRSAAVTIARRRNMLKHALEQCCLTAGHHLDARLLHTEETLFEFRRRVGRDTDAAVFVVLEVITLKTPRRAATCDDSNVVCVEVVVQRARVGALALNQHRGGSFTLRESVVLDHRRRAGQNGHAGRQTSRERVLHKARGGVYTHDDTRRCPSAADELILGDARRRPRLETHINLLRFLKSVGRDERRRAVAENANGDDVVAERVATDERAGQVLHDVRVWGRGHIRGQISVLTSDLDAARCVADEVTLPNDYKVSFCIVFFFFVIHRHR